jgi:hypothetical protein
MHDGQTDLKSSGALAVFIVNSNTYGNSGVWM